MYVKGVICHLCEFQTTTAIIKLYLPRGTQEKKFQVKHLVSPESKKGQHVILYMEAVRMQP